MSDAVRVMMRGRENKKKKEELGLEMKWTGLTCFYTGVNRIGSCEPVWFTPGSCVNR